MKRPGNGRRQTTGLQRMGKPFNSYVPVKDEDNVIAISRSVWISYIKKEKEVEEINRQYQYIFENSGDAILIVELIPVK